MENAQEGRGERMYLSRFIIFLGLLGLVVLMLAASGCGGGNNCFVATSGAGEPIQICPPSGGGGGGGGGGDLPKSDPIPHPDPDPAPRIERV
jgi:hypothetical protein